jgi:hypothetical protein
MTCSAVVPPWPTTEGTATRPARAADAVGTGEGWQPGELGRADGVAGPACLPCWFAAGVPDAVWSDRVAATAPTAPATIRTDAAASVGTSHDFTVRSTFRTVISS